MLVKGMFSQSSKLWSVLVCKANQTCGLRLLHISPSLQFLDSRDKDHAEKSKQLIKRQTEIFDKIDKKEKNKKAFQRAVLTYLKHENVHRRGHVEFIYAAMEKMQEFDVHRDLDTYKKILKIFPAGKMVPRSIWQAEFMHYPKQQNCAIELLEKMERNTVLPDDDTGYLLKSLFGTETHVFRRYQRMMYWMPKFKNANPYPLPLELPEDPIELAVLALKKMAVDLENKIAVHRSEELEMTKEHTFIAYAQSPAQKELINEHCVDNTLFVEGGYPIWIKEKQLTYFVLRADASERIKMFKQYEKDYEASLDDVSNLASIFTSEEEPKQVVPKPTIHEQDDGTILAMCITGTGSKHSLISWINFLQDTNPKLKQIPILFSLRTPEAGIINYEQSLTEQALK